LCTFTIIRLSPFFLPTSADLEYRLVQIMLVINLMNTTKSEPLPTDSTADEEAVIASFLAGKPLDPDVVHRVHERAQSIRERVYREQA